MRAGGYGAETDLPAVVEHGRLRLPVPADWISGGNLVASAPLPGALGLRGLPGSSVRPRVPVPCFPTRTSRALHNCKLGDGTPSSHPPNGARSMCSGIAVRAKVTTSVQLVSGPAMSPPASLCLHGTPPTPSVSVASRLLGVLARVSPEQAPPPRPTFKKCDGTHPRLLRWGRFLPAAPRSPHRRPRACRVPGALPLLAMRRGCGGPRECPRCAPRSPRR